MLRPHIPTRPKATGRTLKIFQEEGIYRQYRYSCFITNFDLPYEQIWTLHRQRAEKTVKYDFGPDSFNQQSFYATEAALNFVMMAYNFISLFRQVYWDRKFISN